MNQLYIVAQKRVSITTTSDYVANIISYITEKQNNISILSNEANSSKIKNSLICFYNGEKFDSWIKNKSENMVDLSQFVEIIDDNPNYWLDPNNLIEITKIITNKLIEKNPNNQELYKKNSQKYISKLQELDKKFQELKNCKKKNINIANKKFDYIAKRYNLVFINDKNSTVRLNSGNIEYFQDMEINLKTILSECNG
jgi:ABC-type Zn uptake system ZnuABC Zn-binding protein ZnuA